MMQYDIRSMIHHMSMMYVDPYDDLCSLLSLGLSAESLTYHPASHTTFLLRLILVGASLAEQSGHLHLQVPVFKRRHLGRGTILPRLVLVGPSLAEQSGHLLVPICRSQDQGRPTILPRLVLVGASLAEQSGHLQVPV